MAYYEITVDGQQHSGSFDTRQQAEAFLQRVQENNGDKLVEIQERAPEGSPTRYVSHAPKK